MLGAMINAKPVPVGDRQIYSSREIEIRKRDKEVERIKTLSRSGLKPIQIAREVDRSLWYVNSVLSGGFDIVPLDYKDDYSEKNEPNKKDSYADKLVQYKIIKNMQKSGKSLRSISTEFNKGPSWASQLVRKIERGIQKTAKE